MSGFVAPAPTNTDWFNTLFFYDPSANSGTGGGGSSATSVNYPVAQGLVSFPDGINLANDITFTSATATDNDIIGANNIGCSQLDVSGNLTVGPADNTGTITLNNGVVFSTDINGLNLNSGLTLTGGGNSIILEASTTVASTLHLDGNLQLYGDDRYISLPYTGQDNITLLQNEPGDLAVSTGLVIASNESYNSSNTVQMYADPSTNNLLYISGNLKVGNGSLIATNIYSATGSTSNSINMLTSLSGNTGAKTGMGVYYNLNSTGEVDLVGMGNTAGGGFSFYQSNASTLVNIFNINNSGVISTGNIALGNGSGNPSASLTFGDGSVQTTAYVSPPVSNSFQIVSSAGYLSYTGYTAWYFTGSIPNNISKWGDTFFFVLSSTSFNTASYSVARADAISLQGYNISGCGLATGQNYTVPFATTPNFGYVFSLTSYQGVSNLYFQTNAGNSSDNTAKYYLYCDTNNFVGETITMTVYPQQLIT